MPATNYSTHDAKMSKSERTAIEFKTESHSTLDTQAKNTSSSKHKTEESTTQNDEDAELVASLGDYVCY
jgi:hypothetical protein